MDGNKKETHIPPVVTAEILRNRLSIAAPNIPIYIIDPLSGFEVPLTLDSLGKSIAYNATADLPVRIVIKNLRGGE